MRTHLGPRMAMESRSATVEAALEEAWTWVTDHFPFPGYVHRARKPAYMELPRTALRWLPKKGRILDFGAGPCDKTAMFARIGFHVVAFDDLQDTWHLIPGNRERILQFAAECGIRYYVAETSTREFSFSGERFDMVMLHHVLEHLHDSPRQLLNDLLDVLRDEGILYVTVPNAANLRKRLFLAVGKTNYQPYGAYYWYPRAWRGHVREYVRSDLQQLAAFLGVNVLELRSYNHFWNAVPASLRLPFKMIALAVPGFRDSWMLVARKPRGWKPRPDLTAQELADLLKRSEFYDYSSRGKL